MLLAGRQAHSVDRAPCEPFVRTLCLCALLVLSPFALRGAPLDSSTVPLTEETYNPQAMIITANQLIALGKDRAVANLLQYADDPPAGKEDWLAHEARAKYVAWLCLLLFDPPPESGLPMPFFGGPDFPNTGAPPWNRALGWVNSPAWPRFPLVLSRGVPLLLVQGYMLAGAVGPISSFVHDCAARSSFRTVPYPVPTQEDAERALIDLVGSPRWKALDWHESASPAHRHANENRKIDFLKQQVARVK